MVQRRLPADRLRRPVGRVLRRRHPSAQHPRHGVEKALSGRFQLRLRIARGRIDRNRSLLVREQARTSTGTTRRRLHLRITHGLARLTPGGDGGHWLCLTTHHADHFRCLRMR